MIIRDHIAFDVDDEPGTKRGRPAPWMRRPTTPAAIELVELLNAKIVGLTFLIELEFLGGREKLGQYPIHAEITY